MWKFIKRTFQVIAVLIVLSIVGLGAYANSERLATDMVYLSCTISDANGLTQDDNRILPTVKKTQKITNQARLRKDWIQNKVLLNWVDNHNEHENGLEPTRSLNINVGEYWGYDRNENKRTFNRETLRYRVEYRGFWVERACQKITKTEFEKNRN